MLKSVHTYSFVCREATTTGIEKKSLSNQKGDERMKHSQRFKMPSGWPLL